MKENDKEFWELLTAFRKNINEIKEDLHSCLVRMHIVEMALNDLIRRLEDDENEGEN